MVVNSDITYPITKESQVGRRGKKARKKERRSVLNDKKECELLVDALTYLDDIGACYFRLLEDWQWNFISWNAPKQLRDEVNANYAGWADLFIFKKTCNLNSVLIVELKVAGRKLRKNQIDRARDVNVKVIRNIDDFMILVDDFLGIENSY